MSHSRLLTVGLILLSLLVGSTSQDNPLAFNRYDANLDNVIDKTEFQNLVVPAIRSNNANANSAKTVPPPAYPAAATQPPAANNDQNNGYIPAQNIDDKPKTYNHQNQHTQPTIVTDDSTASPFFPAFAKSWSMIIATELGDKTFFIAAILSMRFPKLPVFLGAFAALTAMTILSVGMGAVLPNLIDRRYTHLFGGALFLYFGVRLLWDSKDMVDGRVSDELQEVEEELQHGKKDDDENNETETASNMEVEAGDGNTNKQQSKQQGNNNQSALEKVFINALTLTFLAEWGDRSQIATVTLAASKDALGVTLGGIIGHGMCTGLAVVGGRMLAGKISEKNATVGGGVTFLVFGIHALFFEE